MDAINGTGCSERKGLGVPVHKRGLCLEQFVLLQRRVTYAAIGYNMRALGWVNHALYACRPSLHVDGYRPFLVNLKLGVNQTFYASRKAVQENFPALKKCFRLRDS